MNEELKKIFESKKIMEKVASDFNTLVNDYITENVDEKNYDSLDKAIMELPECEAKLYVYDMMYDLKEKLRYNKGD